MIVMYTNSTTYNILLLYWSKRFMAYQQMQFWFACFGVSHVAEESKPMPDTTAAANGTVETCINVIGTHVYVLMIAWAWGLLASFCDVDWIANRNYFDSFLGVLDQFVSSKGKSQKEL